jgi:hypothetical protein
MTLKISEFTRFPLTRDDARQMLAACPSLPDTLDFDGIFSVSHCFADELMSNFARSPKVLNACPFVQRIVSAVSLD